MNCDKCQSCISKYEPKMPNGLPPISALFLGLTEDCTHRCTYCFVKHNPAQMTYDMAFRGLQWLANNSNQNIQINYFGGEPLLKWNDIIVPLTITARALYGNRITFNMTTNAYLLTEDKIDFCKKNGIGILFSFDGIKECQDINRPLANGKGSFDGTYPHIKPLIEAYPGITMRMTVNHNTVQYLYDSYKFAADNGFKSAFAAIDTFGEWTEEEYAEYERQLYKVADLFISQVKEGKFYEFNPLIRTIRNVRIARGEEPPRVIKKPNTGKCGIGSNNSVILAPDGNFYTCQETFTIPEVNEYFKVGNIETGVDDNRRLAIISDLDQSKFRCVNPVLCEICPNKGHCEGGCSARCYEQNRDINVMSKAACKDEQIRFRVMSYVDEQMKDNELYLSRTKRQPPQQRKPIILK